MSLRGSMFLVLIGCCLGCLWCVVLGNHGLEQQYIPGVVAFCCSLDSTCKSFLSENTGTFVYRRAGVWGPGLWDILMSCPLLLHFKFCWKLQGWLLLQRKGSIIIAYHLPPLNWNSTNGIAFAAHSSFHPPQQSSASHLYTKVLWG